MSLLLLELCFIRFYRMKVLKVDLMFSIKMLPLYIYYHSPQPLLQLLVTYIYYIRYTCLCKVMSL